MYFSFHVYICNLKCTYFFFSGSHLSFPLDLTSGNTCKLSGHSSGAVDWNGMSLRSLYRRDDLYGRDALVSRLLCHNLYFGPFGSGIPRGLSRICCWSSNWIFCILCRKPQEKVAHSLVTWDFALSTKGFVSGVLNVNYCKWKHSQHKRANSLCFRWHMIRNLTASNFERKMSAVSCMCCPVCMCQAKTFQPNNGDTKNNWC